VAREVLDYRHPLALVCGELGQKWDQSVGHTAADEDRLALDVLEVVGDAGWPSDRTVG
jgi:hypothetical protein